MELSPFDTAWREWMRVFPDCDPRLWLDAVAWHHRNGYVFSTPEYFIMARPVNHTAPPEKIGDNARQFALDDVTAWLVWAASGKGCMRQFLKLMPYRLPYVGFSRNGAELKFYPTENLKRIIDYGRWRSTQTAADCPAGDEPAAGGNRRIA